MVQFDEHPSPFIKFPSSHWSLISIPSPQIYKHVKLLNPNPILQIQVPVFDAIKLLLKLQKLHNNDYWVMSTVWATIQIELNEQIDLL